MDSETGRRIELIREAGLRINVEHLRLTEVEAENILLMDDFNERVNSVVAQSRPKWHIEDFHDISPFGGCTHVTISDEDDIVAEAGAICSVMDPFQKTIGLAKAVGRAWGILLEKGYSLEYDRSVGS